jgi:hypothetical protein
MEIYNRRKSIRALWRESGEIHIDDLVAQFWPRNPPTRSSWSRPSFARTAMRWSATSTLTPHQPARGEVLYISCENVNDYDPEAGGRA